MVGLVGAAASWLLAAAAGLAAQQPSSRPHIVTVITDDMGFADTQVHNPDSFMTAQFGELARSGITLTRHHTYLWCSPTRRSFMTGRFPVHITGSQAPTCSNFSPLQFAYLPAKLKLAGYVRTTTTTTTSHPDWSPGPLRTGDALHRQGPPRPDHAGPPADQPRIRHPCRLPRRLRGLPLVRASHPILTPAVG